MKTLTCANFEKGVFPNLNTMKHVFNKGTILSLDGMQPTFILLLRIGKEEEDHNIQPITKINAYIILTIILSMSFEFFPPNFYKVYLIAFLLWINYYILKLNYSL